MSLVQTQTKQNKNLPSLAKLFKSSYSIKDGKIPIVRHIIKDEEVEEAEVN